MDVLVFIEIQGGQVKRAALETLAEARRIASATAGRPGAILLGSSARALAGEIRGPFRVRPKPPWFVTHRRAGSVARRLAALEWRPGLSHIPGIVFHALRA